MDLFNPLRDEFFHPSVYPQNSDDSIVTNKGLYDFENFSDAELKTVIAVLKSTSKKYSPKYRGIGLAIESYPIVYKARYILHEVVIILYSNSSSALDKLAVGLAYKTKGYYYYPESINYIGEATPEISVNDWNRLSCSFIKWKVFSDLAEMCLSIGKIEDALTYAQISNKSKPELFAYDYILYGRILKELDINACLKYYSKLLNSKSLQNFHSRIEVEYTQIVKLSEEGYTYQPKTFHRSSKAEEFEKTVHNATVKILKK